VNILVTGADGFIGRALVARLLSSEPVPGLALSRVNLTLLDQQFEQPPVDPRTRVITGDIADRELLQGAVPSDLDYVFHLASVPGGRAESNFELGSRVNLEGTISVLEMLRQQALPAKLVFASTIGVYGVPFPPVIDESTVAAPSMSYGAQKLIGEILVSDYSRRGFIDGRTLRLPGIVARPPQPSGMLSAFMSDIIRNLSAGRAFDCPVAPDGMAWWMSRICVVENLLHAAALSAHQVRERRVWLLPVLRASLADIVAAIARVYGAAGAGKVTYHPNPTLQAQFANLPPLHCPDSFAAGFKHDGTLEALVERALAGP
jgi:D-erythronate 2-dehydrogenase